jgi:hypothetical protein
MDIGENGEFHEIHSYGISRSDRCSSNVRIVHWRLIRLDPRKEFRVPRVDQRPVMNRQTDFDGSQLRAYVERA